MNGIISSKTTANLPRPQVDSFLLSTNTTTAAAVAKVISWIRASVVGGHKRPPSRLKAGAPFFNTLKC